jgi:hypothetical protein
MNYHPENQGLANQQSLAGHQAVGKKQCVAQEGRQRNDEAFRKICKDMQDFWESPTGIACETAYLLAAMLPILFPAALVAIAMYVASSR